MSIVILGSSSFMLDRKQCRIVKVKHPATSPAPRDAGQRVTA
jgi:hypothetical protein